jgi:AcrR family transcriptional regulator
MMSAARDSLLDAAFTALDSRPWTGVRMVDVASAAGVSRQTLYNEFGSKEGLARALVRREADAYLTGVEEALTGASEPGERLAAAAVWTVRAARRNPLIRAALTGCWGERLPAPECPGPPACRRSGAADRPFSPVELPSPADLLGRVRDRAVRLLAADRPQQEAAELGLACETAARLALSYVVAPAPPGEVESLVRRALPPAPAGRRAGA